jgi:excisionase family DNA binding protein
MIAGDTLGLPDPETRPTLTVWPETGRLLGLSKASTYAAVACGEIPSIRIGRRLLVPTAALRRLLAIEDGKSVTGGAA